MSTSQFTTLVEGHLPIRAKPSPEVAERYPSRRFQVRVGHPIPSGDDYACPLEVEGYFEGTKQIMGAAPLDALMNAMVLVKRYYSHVNGLTDEPLPELE